MVLFCGEDPVLSAGKGGRTREPKVGAGDCASAVVEFGGYSVQECEDFLCFRDFSAVGGDSWMVVTENAMNVTEWETRETEAKDELEKGRDGKVDELHFGVQRDAWGG